ncbi:MAG: hypothetical protein RL711_890 [Bacteroidota bacterium]
MKNLLYLLMAIVLLACEPAMESSLESSNQTKSDSSNSNPLGQKDTIPIVRQIYPNPCRDILNVKKGKEGLVMYYIFYPDRKTMLTGTLDKFTNTINMSKVAQGEYIIRFMDSTSTKEAEFYLKVIGEM